jgi:glycosyltransferase involved in cell wall biosynthesis
MIAINGKIFTQRMSGLGRFAFEVIKRMIAANIELTIFTPNKSLHSDYQILIKSVIRDNSRLSPFLWEVFRLGKIINPTKFSLLWSPANIGPINPLIPHYITLHDLTFIHNPAWMNFKGRVIYKNLIPLICKRANAIIADCEFVRQELINYLPFKSPEDIYMTYLGGDHVVLRKLEFSRFELPERYFVFLGNIDKRKNLDNIILAWKHACENSDGTLKLFLVGSAKSRDKYQLEINDESIQLLTNLPDDELFYLLSKSRGLIFPSLYEGFGLPILEAMRCNCPVITSNLGAMAEVAGDAALLVDPFSVECISSAILDLAYSDEVHLNFSERGYQRQQDFTWNQTAEYYIDLLCSDVSLSQKK